MSTYFINLFTIQVAVLDLNQCVGEECKRDLDGQYGEDNCVFIQCDVTDAGKLEGNAIVFSKVYIVSQTNIIPLYIDFLRAHL